MYSQFTVHGSAIFPPSTPGVMIGGMDEDDDSGSGLHWLIDIPISLGMAAVAYGLTAFNLMFHGDNTVPLIPSISAAIAAGALTAFCLSKLRA